MNRTTLRTAGPALAPLLALALAGCVHTDFVRTGSLVVPPRPAGCYVELVLTPQPLYPYVILGRLTTEGSAPGLFGLGETETVALQRLRDEACALGGHFLMSPDTGSQTNWSWGRHGGDFSRSSRGAAVVGVYVTPQGQPLPPPTGPSSSPVVIPQGQVVQPLAPAPGAPPGP